MQNKVIDKDCALDYHPSMINTHNLMTVLDDAGVNAYSDTPLRVQLGDDDSAELHDVTELTIREDPSTGQRTAVAKVAEPVTGTESTDDNSTPTAYTDQTPDNSGSFAEQPPTADQVPASGGSGAVSSDTGPKARREW